MTWGVAGLAVWFGARPALEGVTLEVPSGRVTAVVGGDGAGKTTLLRVMAGLVAPTQGTRRLPERARRGYLPARAGGFRDLTVAENLEFVASVARLPAPAARTEELLERTGLAPFRKRLARDLSGGMRQKLGVIMAMLPTPALLVLDEPTTGVDPVSRSDLWRLIALAAARRGGGAGVLRLPGRGRAGLLGAGAPRGPPPGRRAPRRGALFPSRRGGRGGCPDQPGAGLEARPAVGEWRPDGDPAAVAPGLEDVVIVASLAAEARRAS